MKKRLLSLCLVFFLLVSLVACGDPASTPANNTANTGANSANSDTGSAENATSGEQFLIGTYLQLTGNNSAAGITAMNGIDLAVKQINEQGGFNGAQVVVEHFDTTGSTEEAVKIVQRMISSDTYDAIIGSVNSNEVSACIEYINEAKIYNFGLGTSPTWMQDDSMIYTFRASPNNDRIAPLDVDAIMDMGYTKVAILSGTDDTGAATADAFEAACAEKGVTVTTRQQCDTDDTDFTGQITQILATDPECIYIPLINSTFGPVVKQFRNSGYKGMFCLPACYTTEYQRVAGMAPNTNYIFWVYPYITYEDIDDCDIPFMKEFLAAYSEEYGELPPHECAYRGYDTVLAMWEASKIAGSNDDEALREATHKVTTEGLGGTMDFTDGSREAYSEFYTFMLFDNKSVLLSEWRANGGYEEYLATTGRAK